MRAHETVVIISLLLLCGKSVHGNCFYDASNNNPTTIQVCTYRMKGLYINIFCITRQVGMLVFVNGTTIKKVVATLALVLLLRM